MTQLADPGTHKSFMDRLEYCERYIDELNEYDSEFITDLRTHYENRESQIDMGITPWIPSTNQWNYLINVREKLG